MIATWRVHTGASRGGQAAEQPSANSRFVSNRRHPWGRSRKCSAGRADDRFPPRCRPSACKRFGDNGVARQAGHRAIVFVAKQQRDELALHVESERVAGPRSNPREAPFGPNLTVPLRPGASQRAVTASNG